MASGTAVQRVAAVLRVLVEKGKPGDRLPAVRALVEQHEVSPVTVSRALALLADEGLVIARPGDGTFVAERRSGHAVEDFAWQSIVLGPSAPRSDLLALVAGAPKNAISLGSGYMDVTLLPTRELSRAMSRVVRGDAAWTRAPIDGVPPLREWFARRAGGLDPNSVLIVQGGQAAIRIALQATTPPGRSVLFESPTYIGASAVARALGLRPVPVPTDADGVRPELLEAAFATSDARVLYCQPAFSNPSGALLSAARRKDVLELCRRYGAFVIEDDYARDLEFEGKPLDTLASADTGGAGAGHVIYVRSLTKSVAPSMRVAALCARGPVLERLRASRVLDDFFVPRPLQETAVEFLSSTAYERHIKRLTAALAERVRVVAEEVTARLPGAELTLVPRGGFSLWLALPPGSDAQDFAARAAGVGVAVSPGAAWFPAEATGQFIRLSVAAADGDAIREAFRRLAAMKSLTP
jgi:DNA-binding transcriptional MocR family regulator